MSFKFYYDKVVFMIVLSSLALVLSVVLIWFCIFNGRAYEESDSTTFNQSLGVNEVFVVDRLEGAYAVCEDLKGEIFNFKLASLPKDIKEGNIINKVNGKYFINKKDTNTSEKRIKDTANKMWN